MIEELTAAATWWGNQLRNPPSFQDAGTRTPEEREVSALVTMGHLMGRAKNQITEEQIACFEATLIEICQTTYRKNWRIDSPMWGSAMRVLACDYGPGVGTPLSMALQAAGITDSYVLPIKTVMLVDPGLVRVAHGYGAPFEVIYAKDHVA